MDAAQPRMSWDSPEVYRYEETISLKIPGYTLLYEMTDHLLAARLTERERSCELLVVGAGGGQEAVTFGGKHANWNITGVDPSERMLEIARARIAAMSPGNRVSLINGTIESIPPEPQYDAATCMLVLHFVKGAPQKKELIHRLAERLKPGAPLAIASLNGVPSSLEFSCQMQAWKTHMLQNGIQPEEWERFATSIGPQSEPVSGAEVTAMLKEAGFTAITQYFGSYLIEAYFAVKE